MRLREAGASSAERPLTGGQQKVGRREGKGRLAG